MRICYITSDYPKIERCTQILRRPQPKEIGPVMNVMELTLIKPSRCQCSCHVHCFVHQSSRSFHLRLPRQVAYGPPPPSSAQPSHILTSTQPAPMNAMSMVCSSDHSTSVKLEKILRVNTGAYVNPMARIG